jgi:hypothetical protein
VKTTPKNHAMWWRVLYLIAFLGVNVLWFQSVDDDAYAKAPLLSFGRHGIIIADSALIFRCWSDWTPVSAIPAAEFDPSMSETRLHGSSGPSTDHFGGVLSTWKGWDSDGAQVLRYRDLRLTWFPLWLVTLPSIFVFIRWFARWHRARKLLSVGRCPACGYDLRATPVRCPECGQLVAR